MKLEDVQAFLSRAMPFDTLEPDELAPIASTMTWKKFGLGAVIIKQGTQGENFYAVRSGLVKVYLDEEGKETIVGFLGEGDCFGEMSLLNGEPTAATVETVEPTLCLVQSREQFLEMMQAHPLFYRVFNQLLTRRMQSVYREVLAESPGIGQVEPFLFRKRVGEMMSPGQVSFEEGTSIREAVRAVVDSDSKCVIVVRERGEPLGLVRLGGLARAVMLDGVDADAPVRIVMQTRYHSIDANGYFFDALHEMVTHQTDKLVVTDDARVTGVLTGFDLLRFRGMEVLSLVRNIEGSTDVAQLAAMRREVEKVLRTMVADGALASQTCKVVSEMNDRMVRRVLQLTEEECGVPPCGYAWLGLGSEGRKEQTLLTDQDNAIVYAGTDSPETRSYFEHFAERAVRGLAACGFPLCKGGVMATNPMYSGSLDAWKLRTAAWIRQPDCREEELAHRYVLLDFRGNFGDTKIEEALRSHMAGLMGEHPAFLRYLAGYIVAIPVPLGFFKNFIVEKGGQYRNRMNIKNYGLVPMVTCVKLLAWSAGCAETNTLERIRALKGKGVFTADITEFLEQAFETFLTLRIRMNLQEYAQGREPTNYLEPSSLSTRQKQLLKEAFLAVTQLQKITKEILRAEEQPFRM